MVLENFPGVASDKKFLELLLKAVNFTGYRLIRRTVFIIMGIPKITSSSEDQKFLSCTTNKILHHRLHTSYGYKNHHPF